jgi:hypothetical protein
MRLLTAALVCGRLANPTGTLYDYDYLYTSPYDLDLCMAACRGDLDTLRVVPFVAGATCQGDRTPEQLALEMGHVEAAALIKARQ